MSKEAALRAMREARYAERTANPTPARRPARPPVAPDAPKTTRATQAAKGDTSGAPEADGLCGHRSMNGRTCTREQGHAAKSHRYG